MVGSLDNEAIKGKVKEDMRITEKINQLFVSTEDIRKIPVPDLTRTITLTKADCEVLPSSPPQKNTLPKMGECAPRGPGKWGPRQIDGKHTEI